MDLPRKLLLVAAPALRASLAEQFSVLDGVALAEAADLAALSAPWPHALILDGDLCGGDPSGVAARLRARGFAGRLAVIASADAPPCPAADAPSCPAADAVLTRPLRFADLLAAVRAPSGASPARIGPYAFGPGAQELVADSGARLRLTEKEAAILARLARADGAIVARDALLREVWGYGPTVSTRTLETHIHRLRRKIEPTPARPRYLVTAAGGYRLCAD